MVPQTKATIAHKTTSSSYMGFLQHLLPQATNICNQVLRESRICSIVLLPDDHTLPLRSSNSAELGCQHAPEAEGRRGEETCTLWLNFEFCWWCLLMGDMMVSMTQPPPQLVGQTHPPLKFNAQIVSLMLHDEQLPYLLPMGSSRLPHSLCTARAANAHLQLDKIYRIPFVHDIDIASN